MHDDPADLLARIAASAFGDAAHDVAERDLRQFVRLAWHVVEPAVEFIPGWHLDAVCEHLQAVTRGQIRNLLINIPPRHMKSLTVGVFWPAWEWVAAPNRRWLFSSYALSLSERDSVKCRRLIESPWYQRHWGDRFSLCGDQNTKLRYENTRGGHRIAVSVGGAATGEGGDRVVVDDPHNVSQRESNAVREEALAWWDQTMSTRLNDPKTGAKVIVMQRVHEKDLSGHVLEQGGYVHLCLPAEFEPARRCTTPIGWRDPRQAEGELLWPARIGAKEIADFKTRLGPDGYAGQFQQRPSPAGGGRFRAEWFRYFSGGAMSSDDPRDSAGTAQASVVHPSATDHAFGDDDLDGAGATLASAKGKLPGEISSPPENPAAMSGQWRLLPGETGAGATQVVRQSDCQRFAVMDPAGAEPGEGRRPCYTVIQVWDVTPVGDMLLVHQYRRQVQAPDVAAAAIRICRDYDVAYIAIEKDGLGLGIVQHVRRAGVAVKAIKARGSKEARSQTAEIRMAAGQIYFPRGAPFLFDLESELLQFPNSQYADQVDALAHAAMVVQRISGGT